MLDNEPDTNNPRPGEDASSSAPASNETAPAQRPRRRAASRPAGPPTPAAAAPPIETVAPEPVAPEPAAPAFETGTANDAPAPVDANPDATSASAPPAKKTARKRTTKKAVAESSAGQAETDGTAVEAASSPPQARAPRKRTAKKTPPAAAESTDAPLAPVDVTEASAPSLFSQSPSAPVETTPAPDSVLGAPVSPFEPTAPVAPTVDESAPAATDGPDPIDQRLAELTATRLTEPDVESPSADLDDPTEGLTPVDEAEVQAEDEAAVAPDAPSDDQAPDDESSDDESSDDSQDDGNRRRRRRRGGRRRRRTGADDDSDSDTPESGAGPDGRGGAGRAASTEPGSGPVEETDASATASSDGNDSEDSDTDDDVDSETQRRRRRRRRRRGEDAGSSPDDPTEVVVRVREPRRSGKSGEARVNNEVTGIEGSTRMEAKRQRRRDGRDAGRRRPPILSEAEFLTRRESVSRKMIIRQREDLSQIAVLEDDVLVEHYVDRDSAASLIGNVYLGRVQNVLPSMEAAFIDIGRGRNAVLYAGEVDWDSFGAEGHGRKVEKVLKSGQPILVQVSKDPVGAKGARLTNNISMPGRYIVYSPSGHLSGISRKLPDVERKRLRDILADLVGQSASVIVRTAAEGASEDELVRDVNRLKAQWADIERKVASGSAPQLLYGEPDLTVRIVRDLFTEDFSELIIAGNGEANDAYDAVDGYVTHVAPHLADRMRRWEGGDDRDVFADYRLDEQIAKAVERKVFLPSGGSLVIDRTEAMTVIDVNTGKFTGSGGNLEATVTSNNLEAAEEIVRQLRLRDIGGIIVIDFIDMVLPANRELLLRRLVECLGRDRTRHQVAEVTSLGLVQMTRKKIGTGLLEAFTTECPHCLGRGVEIHDVPVESQKQADGGTREPRPRDQRSGRGSGGNSGGSSGGSGGGRSDQRSGGGERKQAEPRPTEPAEAGEPSGDDTGAGSSSTNGSGSEERSGSGRSRRGGRNRRGGGRDQSEASENEPASPESSSPESSSPESSSPDSSENGQPSSPESSQTSQPSENPGSSSPEPSPERTDEPSSPSASSEPQPEPVAG